MTLKFFPHAFLSLLVLTSLLMLLAPQQSLAQHPRRETLTPAEIEEIREAAVVPFERVKIYTRITQEHANRVKDLAGRPRSAQRAKKLDDAIQDLTSLMDELGGNLDVYSDRHSDIRKALKPLAQAVPEWVKILRMLPGEPEFDLSRKEGIESGEELADQATRLLHEQEDYFATHKDERGQEREDPSLEAKPKQ
jgi:hypothetical protein